MLAIVSFIVAGGFLLYKGAEWLVGSSARIAQHLRVSRVVIGLTIIALGTSLPEFITSLLAALDGSSGVALGNVIGSNMANIGLVLAVAVIIKPLKSHVEDLYRDAPWLILGSVLFLIMALDGTIGRIDGGILVLFSGWFYWYIFSHVKKSRMEEDELPFHEFEIKAKENAKNYVLIALGLGALVLGARMLVTGAVDIATYFGASELAIGITIVALGTSLPELAASAWSSVHGKSEVTLGNVIGSNIANIFVVLGLVALLAPINVPHHAIQNDIPIVILYTFLALLFIRSKERITRLEGSMLLVLYIAYVIWSFI